MNTLYRLSNFAYPVIFVALAVGQLFRLSFLGETRVTVTWLDMALGVSSLLFLTRLFLDREVGTYFKTIWKEPFWKWMLVFVTWAAISLAINASRYTPQEGLTALAYLVRLVAVMFVGSILYYSDFPDRASIIRYFLWTGVALIAFGFMQLFFIPDFSFMQRYGWDPHFDRILSTFFDPNFFGVLIILFMAVVLSQIWSENNFKKEYLWLLFVLAWLALYLTYSRSAWLTGAIALIPFGFWKHWRYGLAFLLVFTIAVAVPNRLSSRVQQVGKTVQELADDTDEVESDQFDPSAAARVNSFNLGWRMALQRPITGVGYNAYGPASVKSGFSSSQAMRTSLAGQGSDSSLLNILATTGVLGLIFFLAAVFTVVRKLVHLKSRSNCLSVALCCFIPAWLFGSLLNNTLLYIFLLTPIILLIANELKQDSRDN